MPDGSQPGQLLPEEMPSDFDGDAYLRAFPDVAKAVAEGRWLSPWHHYKEFGYLEDRLSQGSYVRIANSRNADGAIVSYGHSTVAGGWVFCGWVRETASEGGFAEAVVQFEGGEISGDATRALYHQDGAQDGRSNFVLFVQGANTTLGNLIAVEVLTAPLELYMPAPPTVHRLADKEILPTIHHLLLDGPDTESHRELLTLLSTSGYGRLRQAFNTLNGCVDFYGYHDACGGWFFCGWITRSWDDAGGPERLIGRFADGELTSDEIVTGFWPREDIEGRGVGFVMFTYEPAHFLGSLISIELPMDGQSSTISVPASSQRFRDAELVSRLRPIVGQIAAPASKSVMHALLNRKPYAGVDTLSALSAPIFMEFDETILCPPGGVAVLGWLLAKPGVVRAIRFRSESMNELFDFEDCVKIERPDVIAAVGAEHGFDDPRCGFIAYLSGSRPIEGEIYAEVETVRREVGFRRLPASKLEGIPAIKRILAAPEIRYAAVPAAFDRTIGPAIEHLNRRRLAAPSRVEQIQFGRIDACPRFSIVIPLYGRLDYVECQLAFISRHPAAYEYEFIYVLDDPPKRREAERLLASVYSRFRVPFRVLMPERNLGFGPASNAGLMVAHGRYVCFMNSDVFPGQSDWLEQLADRLEADPKLGAVGPLLLYGDGSVQHAGMVFENLPEFGNWPFCMHPRKGMKKEPRAGLRRHIAITGACMLMRSELAREMGGFDEAYVIGDFEDSDLCLRLYENGFDCAVDLDVELSHLERKSQASAVQSWRMNLTLYNAWIHQKRWSDAIAAHPLQMGLGRRDPVDTGDLRQ